MAKTDPINVANPAGDSDPRLGDNHIRTLARAVAELFGIDHYIGPSSPYNLDDAGKHKRVVFQAGFAGSAVSGCFYVSGDHSIHGSLCFTNLSGNNIILTSGTQKVVNDSLLSHGQSIKSAAGAELFKCSGETAIVASGTLVARAVTSADAVLAIPDRGYVDDQIDAHANTTPAAITTGGLDVWLAASASEATKITHPNGLIEVFGYHKKTASIGVDETVDLSSHGFTKILYAEQPAIYNKTTPTTQGAFGTIVDLTTSSMVVKCWFGLAIYDGFFYKVVGY